MILLLDNYDSFSYNLYQLAGSMDSDIKVVRNDQISVDEIEKMNPSHIIISPGPGRPNCAGVCEEVVKRIDHTPILGICLGHQCICEAFGADIVHAHRLMHGKADEIKVDVSCDLFADLPTEIIAARYHSLVAAKSSIPSCLDITAVDRSGEIMAIKHRKSPIYGLQFHPESILTPHGKDILVNFLRCTA